MTKNTKRKVLFVLPALTAGGAERVLITLMNNLDRERFAPVFVTVSSQGRLRTLIGADIPFYALSEKDSVGKSLPRLYKKMKEINPDIAVSTMAHMNFTLLLLKPFFPRTKFVVREAITPSFILKERGPALPLIRILYKWLYPKADRVISPAQAIVDEFLNIVGVKTENFSILPNPVDVNFIESKINENIPLPKKADIHFVSAGRLHYQKGFDRLIENMPRLPKTMDWHLTILGEGPERKALEALVKKIDMTERVSFAGYQENPWQYYASADAFLLPSRSEGLPNVALESLACGTPVIATSESGGISEISALAAHGAVTVCPDMDDFINAMKNAPQKKRESLHPSLLPPVYAVKRVTMDFSDILLKMR